MTDLKRKLEWFRDHAINDILPYWLKNAQTDNGLFFPHFDRIWNRRERDICTLVSQGRLLYNFSEGYRLTNGDKYLEAVNKGAEALIRYFRDPEQGGWFYSCNASGTILDPQKDLYGHDFAMFGLTHAAMVTHRDDLKKEALNTWEIIRTQFRDEHGGFLWKLSPSSEPATRSQNPIMHLFEALFALAEIDESGSIRRGSEEVASFVLNRLIRKKYGVLPEIYDEDWNELPAEKSGRIDVGHQFEWSYLLSRAAEAGWPQDYVKTAEKLLENGLSLGYDKSDGGIMSPAKPDGTLSEAKKGWWEQCEAIRALLHFGIVRDRRDALELADRTLAYVKKNFVDKEYGGWFSQPASDAKRDPASQSKGSEWKLDYHVVSMCAEAVRLEKMIED